METINRRGGRRPGAGPPKKDPQEKRVKTSIQIPKWMYDILSGMADRAGDSRSNMIVKLLETILVQEGRHDI